MIRCAVFLCWTLQCQNLQHIVFIIQTLDTGSHFLRNTGFCLFCHPPSLGSRLLPIFSGMANAISYIPPFPSASFYMKNLPFLSLSRSLLTWKLWRGRGGKGGGKEEARQLNKRQKPHQKSWAKNTPSLVHRTHTGIKVQPLISRPFPLIFHTKKYRTLFIKKEKDIAKGFSFQVF